MLCAFLFAMKAYLPEFHMEKLLLDFALDALPCLWVLQARGHFIIEMIAP